MDGVFNFVKTVDFISIIQYNNIERWEICTTKMSIRSGTRNTKSFKKQINKVSPKWF